MTVVGYGLDFGTSNSALALAFDDSDDVEVVAVDDRARAETLRATLLYLDRDDLRLTGQRASQQFTVRGAASTVCSRCSKAPRIAGEVVTDCRQWAPGGGCSDSRLLAGLKFELAEPSFQRTSSWGVDFEVEELVAEVIRDLKAQADRRVGMDIRRVVVGHPFVFHGAQGPDYSKRQGLALGRLKRAALMAGFEEVVLLPEPQAAALVEDADEGIVVTTDFGGGTFDVSVIDFNSDPARVVAVEGAAVGGELIDGLMFDRFIGPRLGYDTSYRAQSGAVLGLPAHLRARLRSMSDLKHLMRDNSTAALIRNLRANGIDVAWLELLLYQGQAYGFYQSIERAKLDLSAGVPGRVDLSRLGVHHVVEIEPPTFQATIEPIIDECRATVLRALSKAGVMGSDVAYAVRTGGSSQLPAYISMLDEMFGADRVAIRDPFTTVVHGLALEAQGRWS